MAKWTGYWQIAEPSSRKQVYSTPATEVQTNVSDNTSFSMNGAGWFNQMLQISGARIAKYHQYDQMDNGDVSRALDIIAEECSTPDKATRLPFWIEYLTEDNQDIPDGDATTLRAALRHWCKFHDMRRKVYTISRLLVKRGDHFFRKTSDTRAWEYIDATRVIGIEVDEHRNKVNYHVKSSSFEQRLAQQTGSQEKIELEIVPAAAMIHFSFADDMNADSAFGESVLQGAYRDWQKLSMLENASIIYRIVRAPERRVFYIDTGNMPPQRVKQYLNQVKNEMRQRRSPNAGNAEQTDAGYNVESIQEDFFFSTSGNGRGSRVEALAGSGSWEVPELEYFQQKVFRTLRVPTSYLKGADAQGAQYSDGKVGVAYIEELRFANFCIRIQNCLEDVLDREFKTYLATVGIQIDPESFQLRLPEPQNFALYRQAALDAELIGAYKQLEDSKYLSPRFVLKRYLGLTEDELQLNEQMVKQERGIIDEEYDGNVDVIRLLYDPVLIDARKAPDDLDDGAGVDAASDTEAEASDGGSEPEAEA